MRYFLCVLATLTLCLGCSTKSSKNHPDMMSMSKMSPEQIMEKMKEAGTPGPEHAKLQPLIGKWKTESKFWMDPSQPPTIEKGTATHEWSLGKRFVKEEYKGQWYGQPFQGSGTMGYDKVKGEYVSTWIDSAGTGIMVSEGSYNLRNNALDMTAKYSCPMTGGERQSHMVTRIINNNKHVLEMYDEAPDGTEFKMMEITYTRVG